jgi:hypothetical protein
MINDIMTSDEKMKKVAVWQNRILDTFRGPTGVSGDKLLQLDQIERDHMQSLYSKAGGYATLMDAFFDFYLQTHLESCDHGSSRNAFEIAFFQATLWRFRASEIIFWRGYYYDAAAHLRSIFENIFYYGAVRNGYVGELSLFEIPSLSQEDLSDKEKSRLVAVHQRRIASLVRKKMIGTESGLTPGDQEIIQKVIASLHSHVHRAESSFVDLYFRLVQGEPVRLIPEVELEKASQFTNMSVLAAWSLTRLLPSLSKKELFTEQWQHRYDVLDESFAFYLADFEKPIARAFERFIALKLTFTKSHKSQA